MQASRGRLCLKKDTGGALSRVMAKIYTVYIAKKGRKMAAHVPSQ